MVLRKLGSCSGLSVRRTPRFKRAFGSLVPYRENVFIRLINRKRRPFAGFGGGIDAYIDAMTWRSISSIRVTPISAMVTESSWRMISMARATPA
jgi:hypothetical protein